jgi:hypothetical protein
LVPDAYLKFLYKQTLGVMECGGNLPPLAFLSGVKTVSDV